MLRALRISKDSEVALKACRLFRCPTCPRLLEPKLPRPSKLARVAEFNVVVGMDVLNEKDAGGDEWTWLNIVDQGTSFQVCCLLSDTLHNRMSADIIQAFEVGWVGWAGMPERGVILDRATYFLVALATRLSEEGCYVDFASKASPWQMSFVERELEEFGSPRCANRFGIKNLQGKEGMLIATGAVNEACNNLARRCGFSPTH